MNLPSWSVRNRVAVNIIAAAILVSGFFAAATRLPVDLFPDVSTNFIQIQTIDPTSSTPEDIERGITIPIEQELGGITGLLNLISVSQDNVSSIFLEIDSAVKNLDPVVNEVRQQVTRARPKLSSTAEEPLVQEFEIPFPLQTFGLRLPPGFDRETIRTLVSRMEQELRSLRGVADILIDGLPDPEIWIEVDPYMAEIRGLSLPAIQEAVNRRSRNWVGGRIEGPGGERVVRVPAEVTLAEELESLGLPRPGGGITRLRDLAMIKDTAAREQTRGRLNLNPAITFTVVKKRGADALKTAAETREVFERLSAALPPEIEALVVSDTTKYIDVRIQTVLQNGIQALIVVTLLLVLLLDWRLAGLIAVGLPISFAGAFLVLYWMGETINLLSLFALIMALGMIVDDALVVAENVYRYYEEGKSRFRAAVDGASEVIWPVLGSVATTVAAFLPLVLAEGILGQFLLIIPIVVISALAFSLVQAFIVLPSHLCDFVRHPPEVADLEQERAEAPGGIRRAWLSADIIYQETRMAVDRFLKNVIEIYLYLLGRCLRWRYAVIAGFVFLLVGGLAMVGFGLLRFQLFATDFADRIFVKLELPANASLDQTEDLVRRLEQTIITELPETDLHGIVSQVGARLSVDNQFLQFGSNLAMVTVDLDEQNPLCRPASVIERHLNRIVAGFPELVQGSAEMEGGGPPVGRPINVLISGADIATIEAIAVEMEGRLRAIPGVFGLSNNLSMDKPELRVVVDEERAAARGLDVAGVGLQVTGAIQGLEAARSRRDNDEVVVRVLYEERLQRDPERLSELRLINREGRPVALEAVAEIVPTSGFSRINRRDQQRVVTLSGSVDARIITSRAVNRMIESWLPEYSERYPEYRIRLAGENEDTERSIASMQFAAFIAFLLIYVILAVLFNSFFQPLIVMAVIPFGIVGVIAGLLVMGEPLGLMAIMGTIALSGIVVNNSVVFLDFMNRRRLDPNEGGAPPDPGETTARLKPYRRWRSILISGRIRFRPIFLTTATTIAGLFSLGFFSRGQEEFLAPMAQAIIFGLIFASLITMVLIPCLYAILDDFRGFVSRRRRTG